jgi:hypothetical protein
MTWLLGMFSVLTDGQPVKASPPGPKLVLASPEHSFGDVKPGTPLTHTFKIRTKDKPTWRSRMSNRVRLHRGQLRQGRSRAKKAPSNSRSKIPKDTRGEVMKTADVSTNDPEHQLRGRCANFTAEAT